MIFQILCHFCTTGNMNCRLCAPFQHWCYFQHFDHWCHIVYCFNSESKWKSQMFLQPANVGTDWTITRRKNYHTTPLLLIPWCSCSNTPTPSCLLFYWYFSWINNFTCVISWKTFDINNAGWWRRYVSCIYFNFRKK